MKTLSTILTLSILFISSSLMATGGIEVLKTDQDKSSLLFKLDKELVGATIDIVYSNGDLVTQEVLKRKKLLLDMSKVKEGQYTLIINKGDQKENFMVTKDSNNRVQYGK